MRSSSRQQACPALEQTSADTLQLLSCDRTLCVPPVVADLPALQAVGRELQTSQDLVAASVAIYMFTVGLGSLVWGPAVSR